MSPDFRARVREHPTLPARTLRGSLRGAGLRAATSPQDTFGYSRSGRYERRRQPPRLVASRAAVARPFMAGVRSFECRGAICVAPTLAGACVIRVHPRRGCCCSLETPRSDALSNAFATSRTWTRHLFPGGRQRLTMRTRMDDRRCTVPAPGCRSSPRPSYFPHVMPALNLRGSNPYD
jgi:hypothetical protein